jgi:hypothetical protein
MTQNNGRHPDMLRRFVATPYSLTVPYGRNDIHIRSNDLEVALTLRRYVSDPKNNNDDVRSWKVIRDSAAPVDSKNIFLFEDGALRTLHAGTGTILAYDRDSQEVLGFLAPDVKAEQLTITLLPALTSNTASDLLQKSDKQHIAG